MKIKGVELKVADVISNLRNAGADGLETFEKKINDNARNRAVFEDLLSEARAALMFLHHGFKVTMRESPDLYIQIFGEALYAEVKHFHEKQQDLIDEQKMRGSDDLVMVGNTIPLEGSASWEQVAQVAIKKAAQYMRDAPNILVIETDSNSVKGIILQTAVNIYDEIARSSGESSSLRRLNGFVLIDQWVWPGDKVEWLGSGYRNIIFHQTRYATIPLDSKLVNALSSIQEG